jgi:glutathione synthase/RimK-type ligase-like ATP-grasp enzyme
MDIADKLTSAELLYKSARQRGLRPAWVRPKYVFTVSTKDGDKCIDSADSLLNTQYGIVTSRNKYQTRLVMEQNKLPNIPFALPQTLLEAEQFLARHKKIIVKPVAGCGSRDIHIVTQSSELEGLDIQKYIVEKYIAGKEMRYLVLNNEVIAVHRSEYGTSVDEHRYLERISYARQSWDPELIDLSLHIARIIGLQFAAVDFLIDDQGRFYILEVNTRPGLKWFHAPSAGPAVDVASQFLEAILSADSRSVQLLV